MPWVAWDGAKWLPLKAYPQNTTYCDGTLPEPDVTITITETNISIWEGDTKQLTAVVDPTETTGTITWSTSDPSIATVSNTGLVTAVRQGQGALLQQ